MAKIALRNYTREIEELIEHGNIEEAVAHARHILETFPKHIATYRLLGKAYLEDNRYGDAADIFQRVLSSVPDDFVSHVGMSIIREDEGNLDAAIWHMERAFEAQPSNQAIQDELRRLYGVRDGVEPPKIRLTRGALARMYAHGDLHDQAIAELQAALADDPQRPDLQVLLARMAFENGEHTQAAEISTKLLEKLPFCLEANRLLAGILKDTDRSDEVQTYRHRVEEMDPYAVRTTPSAPRPEDVPAQAITIERTEWHPGRTRRAIESKPAWAASLGEEIEEQPSDGEGVPDWLSSVMSEEKPEPEIAEPEGKSTPGEQEPFEAPAEEPEPAESEDWLSEFAEEAPEEEELPAAEEAEVPDFIEASGWELSKEDVEEPTPMPIEEPEEEELAPADIPDWMLDMKPEEVETAGPASFDDEGEIPPSGSGEDVPEWLRDFIEEPAEADADLPLEEEAPDWLEDFAESEEQPPEPEEEAALEWPHDVEAEPLGDEEVMGAPLASAEQESSQEEDLSDWMRTLDEEPAEEPLSSASQEPEGEEDLADWLRDLEAESAEEAVDAPMSAPEATIDEEGEALAEEEPQEAEDAMAWLESLAAERGADEEELITPPEDRPADMPDWLAEEASQEASDEEAEPAPSAKEIGAEEPVAEESLDWLDTMGEGFEGEEDEEIAPAEEEEQPDWLSDFREQAEMEGEEPPSEPTGEEEPGFDTIEIPEPEVAEEGEDFSWLDSLTVEQGQPEGEITPEEESAREEPAEQLEPSMHAPEEAGEPEPAEPVSAGEEPTPEWLQEVEAETTWEGESEPPADEKAGEEVPEWLQGLTDETVEDEHEAEEQPEWLPDLSAEAAEGEPQLESDWMPQSVAEVEEPAEEPEAEKPEPETKETPKKAKPRAKKKEPSADLTRARDWLNAGKVEQAVEKYEKLVRSGRFLDEIIGDLKAALVKHPLDTSIWQTLGDAYMRTEHLQEALDSYTKAEELLR